MKHAILLAGAVALGFAGPAIAKPGNGNGHGNGNGNGHAYAHGFQGGRDAVGYGVGGCPPGLAKKNNGCLPPGQAKKLFRTGQRFSTNYGTRWSYGHIPYNLRSRYDLSAQDRYYYNNGYLYQVDPRTMIVQQVISALLR
jgi:hypothetical protein